MQQQLEIPKNPRIAFAGSVNSSKKVLEKLIQHQMNVVAAYGLSPEVSKNVSGFKDFKKVVEGTSINFKYFEKLNSPEIKKELEDLEVDLFFVVGLSQLVGRELLSIPKFGCIGYHPTKLPQGRGRAAIAWIILGKVTPAATFFLMDEGADSGHIIAQEEVELQGDEYPQEVIAKIVEKIDGILDVLLPAIKQGTISYKVQNHEHATYLGKRNPSDGLINWTDSAENIERLVRAVSKPLPGAITFLDDAEIIIWRAKVRNDIPIVGVEGRVVKVLESTFIVQTGQGLLEIIEFEGVDFNLIREGKMVGINWLVAYRKILKNEKK